MITLIKDKVEFSTNYVWLVRLLKKTGWKVKLSKLGELL